MHLVLRLLFVYTRRTTRNSSDSLPNPSLTPGLNIRLSAAASFSVVVCIEFAWSSMGEKKEPTMPSNVISRTSVGAKARYLVVKH